MKALLTAILALTLIPFASFAATAKDEMAAENHKDGKHEHKHEHKHDHKKHDHKDHNDHKEAETK